MIYFSDVKLSWMFQGTLQTQASIAGTPRDLKNRKHFVATTGMLSQMFQFVRMLPASQILLVTSVTNVSMDSLGFQIVKVSGSPFQYFMPFLIK